MPRVYTASFAFFEALWDVSLSNYVLHGHVLTDNVTQAGVTHCFVNLGSDHVRYHIRQLQYCIADMSCSPASLKPSSKAKMRRKGSFHGSSHVCPYDILGFLE
jgi:hypothetical protein